MSEYTPGPWYVDGGTVYAEKERGVTQIASAARGEPRTTPVERDENIKLIAKAPGMHQLLSEVLTLFLADVQSGEKEWSMTAQDVFEWLEGFVKRTNEVINDV